VKAGQAVELNAGLKPLAPGAGRAPVGNAGTGFAAPYFHIYKTHLWYLATL